MTKVFRWIIIAFNYLAFYLLWFLCIWAAIEEYSMLVIPLIIAYLVMHLTWISPNPRREFFFILVLTTMGTCSDFLLALSNLITYECTFLPGIAWWNISLWACFGTTYWHAFSWLEPRPILAAALGSIGAPLCYVAIEDAGAIEFVHQKEVVLAVIALFWAFFLPLTFYLSKKIREKP